MMDTLKFYADAQNPNSIANKLREQFKDYNVTGFLKHIGKDEINK